MSIVLLSPIAGWVADLEETPDAVFAGRVLGDGVAVDPIEGTLRAPCDGEVITLAGAGHAVAIRSDAGAEILMHVGVDSVVLGGEGFQVRASLGQRVRAGDTLLDFDLDGVALGARSLLTPVLVTNPHRFEIVRRAAGLTPAGGVLLELRERDGEAQGEADRAGAASIRFVTGLREGVHARPAARIVIAARALGMRIVIGAHGRTASGDSVLGLMGLGVRCGDEITLWAHGPEAPAAFAALKDVFEARPDAPAAPASSQAGAGGRILEGARGSPGLAIGTAFRQAVADIAPPQSGQGVALETAALSGALAKVRHALAARAAASAGLQADILRTHGVLLDDPLLHDAATASIAAGVSAGGAWRTATRRQTDALAAAADPRLRERRADLLDLERQVLAELYGAGPAPPQPPAGAIVLAEEVLPMQLVELAAHAVGGVAMRGGGSTSHVAIMAASMGLPMLTAVSGLENVPDGTLVILDAEGGRLIVSPDAAAVAAMQDRDASRRRRRAGALAGAAQACLTADGVRIAVYANLGAPDEAVRAVAEGAEGCGLLRSEFLFQDRPAPPDEDEQHSAYQAVADRLDGRPLTIRTLDIGADKPAPYLALPPGENPALGLRGVRASLWRPDLLRIQLRAILRVRGQVAVMAPMVASRGEIAEVRRLLGEEAAALGVDLPALGVMVETPAAALTVASLSEVAEFFSIGANDLTQYALAMDRTLPTLAPQFDGLHPAVVALMRLAASAAAGRGRKISVCGALAADPVAIPLLIGLGVTELSMPPGEIAEAKALIRSLSAADCGAFADGAGEYEDAAGLRRALAERWPQAGGAP